MKIIQELTDMIADELDDSCRYVKEALRLKDERPSVAQTFYSLSMDEMKHSEILHGEVVKIINEYKAQGEVVPEKMQAVYDYLHQKYIDKAHDVKVYMEQYKG